MSWVGRTARRLLRRQPAKEAVSDLGFGVVPDPGLANANWFRAWIGIYQLVDRLARMRGGAYVERPLDERMLYIARGLMRYNGYAQGMIGALRTHTLGANGFEHHAVGPQAKVLQAWLDRWMDDVGWWAWERELYERVHIEGEAVVRYFPGDGTVQLRPIEPEWIIAPDGTPEWTFGFWAPEDDVYDVQALWALYAAEGEEVPVDEFYHVKSKLSVRADKRGRSDFLASAQLLDDSFKTWRNFAQSEAVRQAIIYFSKAAEGVTPGDIEQAIAAEADYSPPASTSTGKRQTPMALTTGAGVEYLAPGTELAAPPGAANVEGTMTGVNAALLAAGRAYQMPLVLISGDMSANNTLDFGDESPFGMAIADEQNWYRRHVRNIMWKAVEHAVEDGQLPEELLEDGTDLEVSAEKKPAKDAAANTQRAKTLYDDKVISARERATMEGVDYDKQQAEIKREQAAQPRPQQPQEALESAGGLVEKEVTVHRGGKTFQQKRMIRPGGAKAIRSMAKKEGDATAKDYLESALHNVDDPKDPEEVAKHLAAVYAQSRRNGHHAASDAVAEAMHHVDAELVGPEEGEKAEFDALQYECKEPVSTGETVTVIRKPVVQGGRVVWKGEVTTNEVREDTQLVTVHRGGKTFQERRRKAKPRQDTSGVPASLVEKAKAVGSRVLQRARELAVKLSPAAMKVGAALGVVFDTPEDMRKFGYNPTTTSGTANAGHDPVKAALTDALGVGVSGHIVASVVAHVLSRVVTYARKRAVGEDASAGLAEFAEFLTAVYKMAFEELHLDADKAPTAEAIAKALQAALGG